MKTYMKRLLFLFLIIVPMFNFVFAQGFMETVFEVAGVDDPETWEPGSKTEISFNSGRVPIDNGIKFNVDRKTTYVYNQGKLVPASQANYFFSEEDFIKTLELWAEERQQFEVSERTTYSNFYGDLFDFNEPHDSYVEYFKDPDWAPAFRTTITYSSLGTPESKLSEQYFVTWNAYEKVLFTYDENKYLIEEIYQGYQDGQPVNSYKYEYSYTPEGMFDLSTFSYWDVDGNKWLTYLRTDTDYDANNNPLQAITSYYVDGTWTIQNKYEYNYQNGLDMGYVLYSHTESDGFMEYSRLVNAYDEEKRLIERIAQRFDVDHWVNETRTTNTYTETTALRNSKELNVDFSLAQNYPNPFNPATAIQFAIPKASHVSLKVYDVLGNEIAELVNEELSAGVYNRTFNAANLSSGIYFYTLRANNFTATKKLMLVK